MSAAYREPPALARDDNNRADVIVGLVI